METAHNAGDLFSVYCPVCENVTDKLSLALLRETGSVTALCPICENVTLLEYNGETVTLSHLDRITWEKTR
jgi:uncharacterized Zn finger protein (UPF0148 family)